VTGFSPTGVMWDAWNQGYTTGNTVNCVTNAVTVWQDWNSNYIQGTTAGTTANAVWYGWNQYYLTGGTTAGNVWVQWNGDYGFGQTQVQTVQMPACQGYAETDEQRVAREEREAAAQAAYQERQKKTAEAREKAAYQERQKKTAEAREKAKKTLSSVLSKKQREQYVKEGVFELDVNGRLYRVKPGCRVERLHPETKKVQSYFCIHPHNAHEIPPEDTALSQKLLLEAAEAEFLKLANETRAA
jgi:hypothetical protein